MADFTADEMRKLVNLMEAVVNEGSTEINSAFELILAHINQKKHDARNDPGLAKNYEIDFMSWSQIQQYVAGASYQWARNTYNEMDVLSQKHMKDALESNVELYQSLARILNPRK